MKKTAAITIFFFAITICASAQSFSNNVTDTEIQDFFTWRTNHKYFQNQVPINRVRNAITNWNTTDLFFLGLDTSEFFLTEKTQQLDTILRLGDKEFILNQAYQLNKNQFWTNKVFGKQRLVKPKPLNKIHKGNDYWEFSIPLFTPDKRFCFIKETYTCGMLCIDWMTLLYEKLPNGKWQLKLKIWAMSS